MKKIVFLAFLIEDDRPGYKQKIHGEARAMSGYGYKSSLIIRSNDGVRLYEYINKKEVSIKNFSFNRKRINKERNFLDEYVACKDFFRFSIKYIKKSNADVIYVRRIIPTTPSVLGFFGRIKKNNNLLVYEYPTYPWIDEFIYGPKKSLRMTIFYIFEKMFNRMLDRYVDFYTYMGANKKNESNYVRIQNAGYADDYPVAKMPKSDDKIINILGVAFVSYWTGYDLVIKSLYKYYKTKAPDEPNIYFTLVGKIDPSLGIEKMIETTKLSEYVHLKGFKTGKELDEEFNTCDICVNALRLDKEVRKIDSVSTLKTVEYCFRGKPQISRTPLTVDGHLSCTPPFFIQVNNEDFDMREIIKAYNTIEKSPSEIRKFAIEHMSWDVVMKRVDEAINNCIRSE